MNDVNHAVYKDQVALFDELAATARALLEKNRLHHSESAFLESALEQAMDAMVQSGKLSVEEGERLSGYLRRDLRTTRSHLKEVARKVRQGADPHRVGTGALGLMEAVADSIDETSRALEGMSEGIRAGLKEEPYRTGEICGPGALSCGKCGRTIRMAASGRVPPCPDCSATRFTRSL